MGQPLFDKTMNLDNWFARSSDDQYARRVDRIEDLPASLRQALTTALQPGEPIRHMIHAPYQGKLQRRKTRRSRFGFSLPWQLSPDWLLALTLSRLLLVSISGEGARPQVISIPLANILHLQSGVILLFSWLEITWIEHGEVHSQEVYFNAVCERFFDQLAMLIRSEIAPQPQPMPRLHSNQEILAPLPYKFKNLIPMRLLLPGEQIARVAFRPAAYARALGIFRQMVSAQLALTLTDRHLLLAEEEVGVTEGSYGLISTFLPLRHICGASLERTGKQITLSLRLELQGSVKEMAIAFPTDMEGELWEMAQALKLG